MKAKKPAWISTIIALIIMIIILKFSSVMPGVPSIFSQKFTRPHLLFEESFETDEDISKNRKFNFSGNKSVEIVSNERIETSAAYFTLDRINDEVPFRTELVPRNMSKTYMKKGRHPEFEQAYWYGFRVYIPKDWQWDDDPVMIMQWHGYPDFDLGEDWRYPPLSFQIKTGSHGIGKSYYVHVYADSRRLTPPKGVENRYTAQEKLEIGPVTEDVGRWSDWVFKVVWSYKNDGRIMIWKNSHAVFEYTGPNAFYDELGPYLKFGLYVPHWKKKTSSKGLTQRHIYFDDFRIGNPKASYEDVASTINLLHIQSSSQIKNQ